MLLLLLLSCLVAASYAAPKHPHHFHHQREEPLVVKFERDLATRVHEKWTQFKLTHEKSYSHAKEEEKRKSVFAENLKKIDEHNELFTRNLTTWTMGINQFADMTADEFRKYSSCLIQKDLLHLFPNKTKAPPAELFPEGKAVPDAVDWRSRGYMTRVKNQGSCGSCWAFATVAAVETLLYQKTGEITYLSEQNLVDCSTWNNGCNGGQPALALEFIIQNGGVDTEGSYQYEAEEGRCRYDSRLKGGKIDDWGLLLPGREEWFKRAVAFANPVEIALDSGPLQRYVSGILRCPSLPQINHAVLLVGYGTSSPGNDYWIIKNSWSTKWGMDGYGLISRRAGSDCGISNYYGFYPRLF